MGVLYTVWNLNAEMRGYLDDLGVSYPMGELSRKPLLAEIVSTLEELSQYESTITDNGVGNRWGASIRDRNPDAGGRWTQLSISKLAPLDQPQDIVFEKGWPELIVHCLCQLTSQCGALVLIADCCGDPLVVFPDADPTSLYGSWQLA